jgi:hypothetical protein
MIALLLYYVGIGLILALPLIYVVEEVDEVPSVNTREVFLTVFMWPWLWILLLTSFVQFLIKQTCTKIK